MAFGRELGLKGRLHIGHAPGQEHVFLRPGDTYMVMIQTAYENLREAPIIAKEAARLRSLDPETLPFGISIPYVRPKGSR